MIDARATREAFTNGEISNIGLIKSSQNAADGITKSKECNAFERILDTGIVDTKVEQ